MNLCSNKDILLWDIVRDGEVYYMNITLKGFFKLRPIAKKTGIRVAVLQRYGLPFFLPKLLKRKVFLAGLLLTVAFWIWSSTHIWDIELEGNYQITQDVFNRFLKDNQVSEGMRKELLDIEEVISLSYFVTIFIIHPPLDLFFLLKTADHTFIQRLIVRKSFNACHPILKIFFKLIEFTPPCLGRKVICKYKTGCFFFA